MIEIKSLLSILDKEEHLREDSDIETTVDVFVMICEQIDKIQSEDLMGKLIKCFDFQDFQQDILLSNQANNEIKEHKNNFYMSIDDYLLFDFINMIKINQLVDIHELPN